MPKVTFLSEVKKPTTELCKQGSKLLRYAAANRHESCFNDVTLLVGEIKIEANRLILASNSDYFHKMFTTSMKEKNMKDIAMKEIEEKSLETIVDFFYSGSIVISNDNVMNILASSDYLCIEEIKEYCFEFLSLTLNTNNVFSYAAASIRYKKIILYKQICDYLSENLSEVAKTTNFTDLSKMDLMDWFDICKKNGTDQKTINEAAEVWVKHNEKMKTSTLVFQRLADFKRVTSDFIEKVLLDEDAFAANINVVYSVVAAMSQTSKVIKPDEQTLFKPSKIISSGGSETSRSVHDVFNILGNRLLNYSNFPKDLLLHCSLTLNDYIYCIGGEPSLANDDDDGARDASILVHRMYINEGQENQWERVAPLQQERKIMGATVHRGNLVVAGGLNGREHLNSAEMYKPDENVWIPISTMNQQRSYNALVSCKEFIYALGGWNGIRCLNSMERLFLDSRHGEDMWVHVRPMLTPRRYLTAVCCKGYIYAIGGEDEHQTDANNSRALNSVEKYDPDRNEWAFAASMNFSRVCHSACVLNDRIYVVGGLDEETESLTKIECYDPLFNKWLVVSSIDDELWQHSVVAV